MSRATQPAQQPRAVPQDPNIGPEGRATQGRTPGKGEYPSRAFGTEERAGGVPGAFRDEDKINSLPDGDEITDETNHMPWEPMPKPNND